MRSNGCETSTQIVLETREGITASKRNAHSCHDTQEPLIVLEHLGTQEVLIWTYGTRRLQGPTAPERYRDLWHPKDGIAIRARH